MNKLNRAVFIPLLAVLIFGGCEKTVNQTETIAPPVEVYGRILTNNGYPEGTGAIYLTIYNILGIAEVTVNDRQAETGPDSYHLSFPALDAGDTIRLSVRAVNALGDSVFGYYETVAPQRPEIYGAVDDTITINSPDSLTIHWSEVEEANKYAVHLHLYYSWTVGDYDLESYSVYIDTVVAENYLTIPRETLFPDPPVFEKIDYCSGYVVVVALCGETEPGDSSSFSGDMVGYIEVEVESPECYLKIAGASPIKLWGITSYRRGQHQF